MPHRKDYTKGDPSSTALAKHSSTHFILIPFSTPTNFKEMNMYLTALLHNDRIAQASEMRHVFIGHTQHELWFTLACWTANYRSSEETQQADDRAENGNLAKCCNVNRSNSWIQAIKIQLKYLHASCLAWNSVGSCNCSYTCCTNFQHLNRWILVFCLSLSESMS